MGWNCNTYLKLTARQVLVMVGRRNRGCSQLRTGQMTQFGPAAERCKVALIHSTRESKRLPKDGRKDRKKHGRLRSVTLQPKSQEDKLVFLSPQRLGLVPSMKTDRRQNRFKATDSMSTAGTL